MSVIFKTLEKLKNDRHQKETDKQKFRKNRNVISLDKITSSLPRLLVAGVLVMAFGVATYYVIEAWANGGAESDNNIVQSETVPVLSEEVHQDENNAPSQINTTEPEENLGMLNSAHDPVKEGTPAFGESPPAQESVHAYYAPPRRRENNHLSHQNKMEKQEAQCSRPDSAHATIMGNRDIAPPRIPQKKSEQQNGLPDKETMEQKMQQEKMHLATVKKNAKICRLLLETQKSLLSENDSRTESLLNELSSYKGQDDDCVMRFRAFWHLKRGRYDTAESLLDLLLQKDGNDLESGINMAVLEIKTNRLDRAQERLERLRRIYADNTQIASLLTKIRKQ